MDIISLKTRTRTGTGKSYTRKARVLGWVPAIYYGHNQAPKSIEIDGGEFWVNKDSRGGIWINGKEKRGGAPKTDVAHTEGVVVVSSEPPIAATAVVPATESEPTPDVAPVPMAESIKTGEAVVEVARAESATQGDLGIVSTEPVGTIDESSDEDASDDAAKEPAEADGKPAKSAKRPARPRTPRKPKKPKE